MKDEGGSSSFALGKKTKIGRLCEGRLLTLLVYDGVYVTVRCPSVRLTVHLSLCLSVCLSHFAAQPPRCAAGLLLRARRAADIDRRRWAASGNGAAARVAALRSAANAGSVTFIADVGGSTETCCHSVDHNTEVRKQHSCLVRGMLCFHKSFLP